MEEGRAGPEERGASEGLGAGAGEILRGGLCPAAWRLNRAVASCDEAALVGSTAAWHTEPRFAYLVGWWHPALLVTGNSPRLDVFGNDFGWGRPVAVRSGGGVLLHFANGQLFRLTVTRA